MSKPRCAALLSSLPVERPDGKPYRYSLHCKLSSGHDGPHHDWSGSAGIRWDDNGLLVERRGSFTHIREWDLPNADNEGAGGVEVNAALMKALERVALSSVGDSNDSEISALKDALGLSLKALGLKLPAVCWECERLLRPDLKGKGHADGCSEARHADA